MTDEQTPVGLPAEERSANVMNYHRSRVHLAMTDLRNAIYAANKDKVDIGSIGSFDLDPMYKELKQLGGFIYNSDKSSKWYDGPNGTYVEPNADTSEV